MEGNSPPVAAQVRCNSVSGICSEVKLLVGNREEEASRGRAGPSDLQPSSQPKFHATSSLFLDHQTLSFAPGRETPDRLFSSAR